ncbi:MAG: hypothetical protein LWY06_14010 [Firmicutes bacterium]|nr:hypothetical protein [Bacillota bacterium]
MAEMEKNFPIPEITTLAPFIENREDFSRFLEYFGKNIPKWAEISVSPQNETIGIMTKGEGQEFAGVVCDYLNKCGVEPEKAEQCRRIAALFEDAPLLVKADFGREILFDFTMYWQVPVSLPGIFPLIGAAGVSAETIAFFRESSLLMRSENVFFGLGFEGADRMGFKVFFSNPLNNCMEFLMPAVASVMTGAGLSANAVNHFIGFHNYLSEKAVGKLFTSLTVGSKPPQSVKLDYEIIPPDYAIEIMKALGHGDAQEERLKMVMNTLGMRNLTYIGIKFEPGDKFSLKFYFDIRNSSYLSESGEMLADYLKNSVWR